MFLKRVLCSATDQTAEATVADEQLREACYNCPPLGGFDEHQRGILEKGAVRASSWSEAWCREGSVGCSTKLAPRQLYKFTKSKKGEPIAALPISFSNTDDFWRTERPPPSWYTKSPSFRDLLYKFWFLDD